MNVKSPVLLIPLLAAALIAAGPTPTAAQHARLGTVDFPNSGTAAAQADFVRGVLLLHSFEFDDAARSFRAAQEIAPDFAMAYWGEAMTYNHPLWRQQDRAAARAALNRLGATPEVRAARAGTPREAAYLAALDVLYGEGTKTERDRAYMASMARLSASHPEDLEAKAFHSLAILGSTDGERDFATYMRAAAVAQSVFDVNPDHPGAAHYLIHSFDDPIHAPLGLEAARAYAEIAPGASHAQHMTSHIFVATGMWDDVVAANIRARDVQNARRAELGTGPNVCGHYTSWLHYGWLQKGMLREAERGMSECRERVLAGGAAPDEIGYFVDMRARHVLDTEDWTAADRLHADVAQPNYAFVTAYAALKRGDRVSAEQIAEHFTDSPGRPMVAKLELAALLALDAGDAAGATALAREAAALEETLPFEFGPPASVKPPHEMLGEILLGQGLHAEAASAFRRALEFTPERTAALAGLAAASRGMGDEATASDADARLTRIRGTRGS